MNIKSVLNTLAKLDERGLSNEVDIIDEYLRKSAAKSTHKSGLEESTVNAHRTLMENYISAAEELVKEKKKIFLSSNEKDNPNNSKLRDICRNLSHNQNASILHKIYFEDVIDSKPMSIDKTKFLKDSIDELYVRGAKDFQNDIKRMTNLTRNGWLLITYCTESKQICLEIIDLHEIGVCVSSIPIAALDLWEHAYFSDFGLDKDAYVDWWTSQMDWRNPEKRLRNLMRIK